MSVVYWHAGVLQSQGQPGSSLGEDALARAAASAPINVFCAEQARPKNASLIKLVQLRLGFKAIVRVPFATPQQSQYCLNSNWNCPRSPPP